MHLFIAISDLLATSVWLSSQQGLVCFSVVYKLNFNVYCSIKYCVFVQYNEWSTCNNVSFRRRVNMGFCIPPLSPFCSARPENCTQLGRNRILVLLCICEPTCVDLCTIVRVFVYEFLPSRIMVAKTTRLVTRAQYRSVVNVLDNVVQCTSYSLKELP